MIERTNKKRCILLIYLMLIVAVITAYEPMRHNGFIDYDDYLYVTENPHIRGGLTTESIKWAFTAPHCYMYHPLTTLSHILDCELYGLNPLRHHATSLLFHTLSTLLLFWVLKRMTRAVWASAFVAAVFALHPLQVESVAWVSERKSILSGFFWILTITAYIHYAQKPRAGRYLLVAIAYISALLSKPIVVTLPFVLLLLDYWPLSRLELKTQKKEDSPELHFQQFSAKRLIIEKLPLFILSAILSVITFVAQHSGDAVMSLTKGPVKYRLVNAFIAYLKYIEKFTWPNKLALFYPHPGRQVSFPAGAVCALALVLLTVAFIYLCRRRRYLTVGWLWFVGTLVPVIGIIQVGGQAMADRYMYIPIIGLSIIITWGVRDITEKLKHRTILLALSAVLVLSALAITTRRQVGYWRNNLTIFKHAIDVTEDNKIMHNNYGIALLKAGRVEEAGVEFRKAIEISPTYVNARFNLGRVLFEKKRFNEAIACFQEFLKKNTDSADANYYLAMAYYKKHEHAQAIKYLSEALRLEPNQPQVHGQLGSIFLEVGQTDNAIKCFNEVLRLNNKNADGYESLGSAYEKKGRLDLAVSNWNQALELEPDSTTTLNNLAWLLASTKDDAIHNPARAVKLAQHACELTDYKNPSMLDTLAVTYSSAGRFDDAVKTAQQAINLAELENQKNLADQIRKRLVLYQANKPYYDK